MSDNQQIDWMWIWRDFSIDDWRRLAARASKVARQERADPVQQLQDRILEGDITYGLTPRVLTINGYEDFHEPMPHRPIRRGKRANDWKKMSPLVDELDRALLVEDSSAIKTASAKILNLIRKSSK